MSYDLYHHGIKGMKWGIRRFQNKNGSLTLLGKKRRQQMDDDDGSSSAKPKPKSVKEMSDKELQDKVNRLSLEQRYLDLNRQVKNLEPAKVSAGKKFVNTVLKNVIAPAAEDVAKQLAKSYMTDAVNKAFKLPDELKVYTNNKKK